MDAKRDWGYAGDYVQAMWMMLQQDEPDDYVIATGETHSVQEFVERAFAEVGIENWQDYVRQDPKFLRPAEVDLLIGDASKARTVLGWTPEVGFPELVSIAQAITRTTRTPNAIRTYLMTFISGSSGRVQDGMQPVAPAVRQEEV